MKRLLGSRLVWPSAVLVLLVLTNLWFSHGFLSIEIRDGHLYGSLIDILRDATPLTLVALGMTVVIATAGIDLSVGSVMAISAAVACLWISKQDHQDTLAAVAVGVLLALVVSLMAGLWNGLLVSVLGIQPIIATLILMVAGRGVAQLITGGQIITLTSNTYNSIGTGYVLTLPICVLLTAVVVAAGAVLTRRTALGLLLESVGGNPKASRLAGIQSRRLIWGAYVFAGLVAGIAGLIDSSNVSSADGNNLGLLIELDAILAVVIGGTSLDGGRFSIAGTVLGSVIITTLDITIVTIGVPTDATQLFKAIVVLILCLVQSPAFRARIAPRRRRRNPPAATPDALPPVTGDVVEVSA